MKNFIVEGLTFPHLKSCGRLNSNQNWYWHKTVYNIDQWNQIENAEMYQCGDDFSTSIPRQFSGERRVFSANDARQLDIHMQKNKLGPFALLHI